MNPRTIACPRCWVRGFWLLVLTTCFGVSHGDDLQPLFVDIVEASSDVFSIYVQNVPGAGPQSINLASPCERVSQLEGLSQSPQGLIATYRCPPELAEMTLTRELTKRSTAALIRFVSLGSSPQIFPLATDKSALVLPRSATRPSLFVSYVRFGASHIAIGFDHLLFVVCLLMLAKTLGQTLLLITGFTVAHSLTLGLSAQGLVKVPVPLVEALIALSILMLVSELAKGPRPTLTQQYPLLVSGLFGLLHGLGFAAVLAEVGLPETDLLLALLAFNLGVEIGQVLFVIAVLILFWVGRRIPVAAPISRFLPMGLHYSIGAIASFWFIERVSGYLWVI